MTATSSQRLNLRPTCALDADQLEAALGVQRARRGARRLDAGDHRVEAGGAWRPRRGGTAAACPRRRPSSVPVDVHRVLDRRAVGRPVLVRRQRGEPDHAPGAAGDGDDGREGARPGRDPALLVDPACGGRGRTWLVGAGDLEVVDGADRLGVGDGCRPERDRGGGHRRATVAALAVRCPHGADANIDRPGLWTAAGGRYAGTLVRGRTDASRHGRSALLAQSAEHSHGKAGVVGSIPTEGSTDGPRSGRPARHQTWRRSSVG